MADTCLQDALHSEPISTKKEGWGIIGGLKPDQRKDIPRTNGRIDPSAWSAIDKMRSDNATGLVKWHKTTGPTKKRKPVRVVDAEPNDGCLEDKVTAGEPMAVDATVDYRARIADVIDGKLDEILGAREATAS